MYCVVLPTDANYIKILIFTNVLGQTEGTNTYLSLNPLKQWVNQQSKLFGLVSDITWNHLLVWLLLILLIEEIPNNHLGCIHSSTKTEIFSISSGDRRISEPSTVPQPSRFSNSKTTPPPPRQNIINHLIFGLLIIASYLFGNPQFYTLSPIFMEVKNGCIWKVTTIGGTHLSLAWLWEEG